MTSMQAFIVKTFGTPLNVMITTACSHVPLMLTVHAATSDDLDLLQEDETNGYDESGTILWHGLDTQAC